MAYLGHPEQENSQDDPYDLSQIFIGRDHQLDLFTIYLNRWKSRIFEADAEFEPEATAPSPNNKIQGFVTLLYGRGGFGKSTLLRRFRDIALQDEHHLMASRVVDWEFSVEGKRSLFNLTDGQDVDANEYFKLLCGQFAIALGKNPRDFKEYQAAVRGIEDARKKASGVLNSLKSDDRYADLRNVTVDGLMTAVGTVTPAPLGKVLDNDKVKSATSSILKVGQDVLVSVRQKLHDTLGDKLGDFLDPALRLGLALGRDLSNVAKNFPVLIFFDTYEEIDEGDRLLRIIMGAAGIRVGWVIAGRDNLWAGLSQIERSTAVEYGYKEIVPSDRALSVNFNAGDIGAFTLSDIIEYFELLRKRVHFEQRLAKLSEEGAKSVLKVTQGVPLAVKIAAGLYLETADLNTVTETVEGKREIVDQMVRRYLLHTRADQSERAKLYGLAMLRRPDQFSAVAVALDLTTEEAKTHFSSELSRLHRRYSFIFTEKDQPTLHQEVREFLRLWLLERSDRPDIRAINERLFEAHRMVLQKLEEHNLYTSLEARFEDEQWVGVYLDVTEQQFWLDPVLGVQYLLSFMILASIYNREINEDAAGIGEFFEQQVRSPYSIWWKWADQSLIYINSYDPTDEELNGLESLCRTVKDNILSFPMTQLFQKKEVEASLWWRLGEAYNDNNIFKSLEWYEKALTILNQDNNLKEDVSNAYYRAAWERWNTKQRRRDSLPLLKRAIELKSDYAEAYYSLGFMYSNLVELQNALDNLNRAIELEPENTINYFQRGYVYSYLGEYQRALEDLNHAIGLNLKDAYAYVLRGYVYGYLDEYQRALEDLNHAIELEPENLKAYVERGHVYGYLGEYQRALEDLNHAIGLEPEDVEAYVERGKVYNDLGEHQRALEDLDRAIELTPKYAYAYVERGDIYLHLNNIEQSELSYKYCYQLNASYIRAALMSEWINLRKIRTNDETIKFQHLKALSDVYPQDYISYICRGLALGVNNQIKEGLAEIERAISLKPKNFIAYFWQGMLCAYYFQGQPQQALSMIEKALALKMPPVLLMPLYWFEKDRPTFFARYAKPLLELYGL